MSAVHDYATLLESAPEHDLEPGDTGERRMAVADSPSVWDIDPAPWATFADALRLDALHRRHDALDAIIDWPNAAPLLRIDAALARSRADRELRDWEEDIDARQAAWHAEHPGLSCTERGSEKRDLLLNALRLSGAATPSRISLSMRSAIPLRVLWVWHPARSPDRAMNSCHVVSGLTLTMWSATVARRAQPATMRHS